MLVVWAFLPMFVLHEQMQDANEPAVHQRPHPISR
jgi:hypothetical protein